MTLSTTIINKAINARDNAQTTGMMVDVYVTNQYHNGSEHVVCVNDIRCAKTGEYIRDHINVNAANNMHLLDGLIGTRVTMHVTWKLYANDTKVCFQQINNLRA